MVKFRLVGEADRIQNLNCLLHHPKGPALFQFDARTTILTVVILYKSEDNVIPLVAFVSVLFWGVGET
jgi:hypothetical protein